MYFRTKSTTNVTVSHLESLVDVPCTKCIPETMSSKVNVVIGGDRGLNERPTAPETPLRGFGSLSISACIPQSKPMGVNSIHPSLGLPALGATKNIMDLLLWIESSKSGRSILKTADLSSFKHKVVKFLLVEYNGNCIFELPPIVGVKEGGLSCLDRMDWKQDGHVWMETATTNISDPSGVLTFKYVKCMDHLRCTNLDCCCIGESNNFNELF